MNEDNLGNELDLYMDNWQQPYQPQPVNEADINPAPFVIQCASDASRLALVEHLRVVFGSEFDTVTSCASINGVPCLHYIYFHRNTFARCQPTRIADLRNTLQLCLQNNTPVSIPNPNCYTFAGPRTMFIVGPAVCQCGGIGFDNPQENQQPAAQPNAQGAAQPNAQGAAPVNPGFWVQRKSYERMISNELIVNWDGRKYIIEYDFPHVEDCLKSLSNSNFSDVKILWSILNSKITGCCILKKKKTLRNFRYPYGPIKDRKLTVIDRDGDGEVTVAISDGCT